MGYTHYYIQNRDLTPQEWPQLTATFRLMLDHLPPHTHSAGGYYDDMPLIIRGGMGTGTPICNNTCICFKGDDTTDNLLVSSTPT